MPKFAVVNKQDKSVLLYDYEPTNVLNTRQMMSSDLVDGMTTTTTTTMGAADLNSGPTAWCSPLIYRLDNSVKKENFINYWRNKSPRFEINSPSKAANAAVDSLFSEKISKHSTVNSSTFVNNKAAGNYYHHHLSNKDIGKCFMYI